ncbi:dialkylrecorsinol condensing enzyme [Pseudomonas capsici]|uniref:dialkylrecorsinol condensing enzyme n=1 Tax=Pseudomonas capsici TaxID=2810614 RepID=UPI0021F1BB6D|nr:dialkylrecorsinol condensing enzyme [Pseudomonas capsici]MCV4343167.1 dialkylresorcinol condensing enzyme [Pseudomonas capsici]
MKRILVVYFSQTGQLKRVADSFVRALIEDSRVFVEFEELAPLKPYPFPWSFIEFFDQFPEAAYLYPPPMRPFKVDINTRYDLVILAYTVWFLSPSPPVTAFLKSAEGKTILRDTAVITLITCRNMWMQAQEQVKKLLLQANARLLDNVVLTDRGSALKTLVTTPRWMFTGNREAFWGVFPRAGLTEEDILSAQRFGKVLLLELVKGRMQQSSPLLKGLKAVRVDPRLIDSEKFARRSFLLWGKLFLAIGPQGHPHRKLVAVAYGAFMICMVATVIPAMMGLRTLIKPMRRHAFERQCRYFEEPSGSSGFRMKDES